MRFVLWGLAVIILITIATRIAGILALRRLRIRAPRFAVVAADAVPPDLRAALEDARAALLPSGFAPAGWVVGYGPDSGDDLPVWIALAASAEGEWLMLSPSALPEHGLPWQLSVFTPLAGGRWLMTSPGSRHLIYGDLPATTITAVPTGTPDLSPLGILAQHRLAMAQQSRGEPAATAEAFLERVAAAWSSYPAELVATGLASRCPDDTARPTLGGAWRTIGALQRGMASITRALAAQTRAGTAMPVPPAVEIDAILRADARRNVAGGDSLSGLVMIAGAVIFLIASGAMSPQWWQGPILLAVLILHEAGHFAAMRLCGYRDTAIFFLPLLGAITTGIKRDASVVQQVAVALAGPVPGIIAGTVLLACGVQGEVAHTTAMMLLLVNLFNLLPLMPLDGGQILHRLLLARFPWLDLIMRTLAVLALGAMGLVEPILLGIAVLLALGLPAHWREARFARACLRDPALAQLDRAGLLVALATRLLATPGLSRSGHLARRVIVNNTAERIARRRPGAAVTVGLVFAWIGAIVVPILVLAIATLIRRG